eukprot:2806613-Karenia_brevis.AAC.1
MVSKNHWLWLEEVLMLGSKIFTLASTYDLGIKNFDQNHALGLEKDVVVENIDCSVQVNNLGIQHLEFGVQIIELGLEKS